MPKRIVKNTVSHYLELYEQPIDDLIAKLEFIKKGYPENVRLTVEADEEYGQPTLKTYVEYSAEETDEQYQNRLKRERSKQVEQDNYERQLYAKLAKKYGGGS
jgi:hypothetical protein